jgi:hypothetical protein
MIDSPLDRSTIYLWQREDVGTIGEQGNHIAHISWKLAQLYFKKKREALFDIGDPKIITFAAWDAKALAKVERKFVENNFSLVRWEDPDHPQKGSIAISTDPIEGPRPEAFANYKLWPTVNVRQWLERRFGPPGNPLDRIDMNMGTVRESVVKILNDAHLIRTQMLDGKAPYLSPLDTSIAEPGEPSESGRP